MREELLEMRTRDTKTFLVGKDDDGNDLRELVVFPGMVHYDNGKGTQEIHPEWRRAENGWMLDHTPYTITVPDGEVSWTMAHKGNVIRGTLLNTCAVPEPRVQCNRLWWLGVWPDFDLCLIAFAEAAAVHSVLHSNAAPRRWQIRYDHGPEMAVQPTREWGRDNIDKRVDRRMDSDMHRELEVKYTVVKCPRGTTTHMEWTGRVKRVDPVTRKRSWCDDVAYPVRIR